MNVTKLLPPAVLCAVAVLSLAWTAPAKADYDFNISQDHATGGKLVVGEFQDGPDTVHNPGPVAVFGFDVEFNGAGQPYRENTDPGFRARPTSEVAPHFSLPQDEFLGFNFKTFSIGSNSGNLWYWNGSGPVSFAPAVGHQLTWTREIAGPSASVNGANTDVSGFSIADVAGAAAAEPGTIHKHIITDIGQGGGEPALGIYLIGLDFTLTNNGGSGAHLPSDLTYVTFATLDPNAVITDEIHDEANDWVQENLVSAQAEAVPEPSSVVLGGIAAGLLLVVASVACWRARRACGLAVENEVS